MTSDIVQDTVLTAVTFWFQMGTCLLQLMTASFNLCSHHILSYILAFVRK